MKKFQREHNLPASGIVEELTIKAIEDVSKYVEKKTFNYFNITLSEALRLQIKRDKKERNIDQVLTELEKEFDPENLLKNEKDRFQLLDLSRARVVTAEILGKYLREQGARPEYSAVFLDAAFEFGVNEIVLVSYALAEKEKGKAIIDGVPVDKLGNITYVKNKNDNVVQKVPGKTEETYKWVYNIYGIGDSDDMEGRVKKGIEEGWYTLEKAIFGGARYIKEMYLGDGKNTFYNKNWDLPMHKERYKENHLTLNKQWISEQLDILYTIYKELDEYVLYLDIPIYKK